MSPFLDTFRELKRVFLGEKYTYFWAAASAPAPFILESQTVKPAQVRVSLPAVAKLFETRGAKTATAPNDSFPCPLSSSISSPSLSPSRLLAPPKKVNESEGVFTPSKKEFGRPYQDGKIFCTRTKCLAVIAGGKRMASP